MATLEITDLPTPGPDGTGTADGVPSPVREETATEAGRLG